MKTTLLSVLATVVLVSGAYGLWFSYGWFAQEHEAELHGDMKFLATRSASYNKGHTGYEGFCSSSEGALGVNIHNPLVQGPLPGLASKANGNIQGYVCNDTSEHWAVTVSKGANKYICIDDGIATVVDAVMGPLYHPGVTLGFEVSQPLGKETSCSSLQKVQPITS